MGVEWGGWVAGLCTPGAATALVSATCCCCCACAGAGLLAPAWPGHLAAGCPSQPSCPALPCAALPCPCVLQPRRHGAPGSCRGQELHARLQGAPATAPAPASPATAIQLCQRASQPASLLARPQSPTSQSASSPFSRPPEPPDHPTHPPCNATYTTLAACLPPCLPACRA